jgi:hypothetical protein
MTNPIPLSALHVRSVDVTEEEWDRRVEGAGGNVFHSSAWGRVARATGGEPVRLEFSREGGPAGLALAAARRSRFPLLGRFRDRLILETSPLLAPGTSFAEGAAGLVAFAHREGFAELSLGTTDGEFGPEGDLTRDWDVKRRVEFRIDLSGGVERTLAQFTSSHRRNLRKANEEGLTFVEDSTLAGALALRDLQDETFQRRSVLGHTRGRAWERDGFVKTMSAYLEAGALRFWFGALRGERLSGVGILTFGTRSYYLVGGTSAAGYEARAAFFVFGQLLGLLPAAGVTSLNLGGVPVQAEDADDQDHGLFRFKAGFGSQILRLATLRRRLRR